VSKPKLYLLQNVGAGYLGNSPVFWAESNSGYTQWIDQAKRWTYREAMAQKRGSHGTHKWKLWPVTLIESVAKRTVDMQDLAKGKDGAK
jgi:hypothetical protein